MGLEVRGTAIRVMAGLNVELGTTGEKQTDKRWEGKLRELKSRS